MNWLVRFTLGLAARPVDVAEIRESAPELLAEEHDVRVMPIVVLVHPRTFEDDRAAFASEVRKWAEGVVEPKAAEVRPPVDDAREAAPCMLVGGDASARFDAFLALVARVHESGGPAHRVLVTDSRLFADIPDEGSSLGFERFCRYLGTLWLADDVTLLVGPQSASAKKVEATRERWVAALRERFASIRLESASGEPRLPDCVYVVEHEGGDVRGVLGPSMATAGDVDVALLGELTLPDSDALVASWLHAAPPARTPAKKERRGRDPAPR